MGGEERVLIVANEAIDGEQLGRAVLENLSAESAEIFVVSPALADSALKHHMGDVDEAIEPAEERLRQSLSWLRDHGFRARGEVGDSDPLVAASDEVQKFQPGRILVIAHAEEEAAHAETDLRARAERDLDQPVAEIVVESGEGEPRVVDVVRTEGGSGRNKGDRTSGNLPPLTQRDVLGILVAVIGTLVVAALTAAYVGEDQSRNLEEGRLGGLGPALVLIAVGVALINLAHVVGLIFFQSVRYSGPFEKFFARMSLIGTPVAVAIALLFVVLD